MEKSATLAKSKTAPSPRRTPYATDQQRWNAVLARDRNADDVFYYSVKTTGVYCRPACGARVARRENVVFHDSREAAELAGFRPCKRCQPAGRSLADSRAATVAQACRLIESAEGAPDLDTLAKSAGMSPFHFHRVFKKVTGLTPKAYATAHRAERVRNELFRRGTVTEAIYGAGYNSNSRFYEKSSEMLGMPPSSFRKGGTGETIRFAVGECSLGFVLVASSQTGVCAILLGDDPHVLTRNLQDRFPKASLIGGDRPFERIVAQVVGLIEHPRSGLDLPLDVRGTVFQQKVWRALREIPIGKTASYVEIARRIGLPKAARAVAQACGANPVAIAIPCHRVVRTDGGISGYRWGVERKRVLLQKEAAGS
jgi:AraC family transcriptional regulator of adaptative response/methylated-DNA-[protein]-cysteine methyltransferase